MDEAFQKLAPLARVHDEDHTHEVTRDASGAATSAIFSWLKAGNRQHKHWTNTVMGTLRLEPGRLEADVNSTWAAWLDTRVPALGNKTPRQAARTDRGRERLEALLAEFDRHAEDGPSSIAAHLAAIRGELALTPRGSGEDTR